MAQIHPGTETAVANAALSLIGISTPLTDIDNDDSGNARTVRLHFASVRDALLRRYPWNFAEKYDTLTALPSAPKFNYSYAYNMPSDCLRVLEVGGTHWTRARDVWKVQGRTILTDECAPLPVIYTRREDRVAIWDALFRLAFEVALAARIAPAKAKDSEIYQERQAEARQALAEAFPVDASEGTSERFEEQSIITERW